MYLVGREPAIHNSDVGAAGPSEQTLRLAHASDETANMRQEGHPVDVVTNAIQSAEKLES